MELYHTEKKNTAVKWSAIPFTTGCPKLYFLLIFSFRTLHAFVFHMNLEYKYVLFMPDFSETH
jgi:hypothetical protein